MSIENKRIQDIINFLVAERIIKNVTEFAVKMGYDAGNIGRILKGERGVSNGLLWKIYDTYRISKSYLFDGIGNIEIEPAPEIIEEENELEKLKEVIKALKSALKSKDITIKSQEITIAILQKQLDPKMKFEKKTQIKQEKAHK